MLQINDPSTLKNWDNEHIVTGVSPFPQSPEGPAPISQPPLVSLSLSIQEIYMKFKC